MSKRLVAGVALLSGVLLAAAGCSNNSGSSGSSGAGKSLQVMVQATPLYLQQQQQWFKDVSDAFQKQTGATVNFVSFSTTTDEQNQLNRSAATHTGPDIYGVGTTFTPTAYATNLFLKLGDAEWNKVGGKGPLVPSTLGISGPSATDQIAIPMHSRPYVMAVNTDLLKQLGLSLPTTWDGLAAAAKKATGNGVYGMAVPYSDGYAPWKLIWHIASQLGNPVLDAAKKKALFDQPEVLTAYKTVMGWYKDGLTAPESAGWKAADALAAFAAGKALFLPMVTGETRVTLDKSALAGHYEYAVMPTVPPGATSLPANGKPVVSIVSGDNWVVANYSKNQDLAFQLIKMLLSDEQQLAWFKTFGDLPVTTSAGKKVATENPIVGPMVTASGQQFATPFSGAWGTTQNAITNIFVQLVPSLKAGTLSDDELKAQLAAAQAKAQGAIDDQK